MNYYADNDEPSSAERHMHDVEVRKAWSLIPPKKRKGLKSFRDSWCVAARRGVEPETMLGSILRYYGSKEGRGVYARWPARLIEDEVWDEDSKAWGEEESNPTPVNQFKPLDLSDCKPLSEYRHEAEPTTET